MLADIALHQILLSIAIIIAAFLIRGIAGFGSGLIAIPLLALMFPLSIVVPVVGLLDYIAATSHGFAHRKHINWKIILPLLPFTLIGIVAALYLFKTVDAHLLRKALGIFVLLFAAYTLFVNTQGLKGSRLWAIPAGLFGGFISALFGTGGPFYVIYMRLQQLDKQIFRATAAAIFLIDGSSRIVGYLVSGFYSLNTLILVAIAIPIMALGLYIGEHIHTSLSQQDFQRGISLILIGSGIALLLQ
ncbi:MAG: sulfite exporter TauE/SafE family protein [Gammaproteobacteria bacterium]|nr:MAG: sulfite exporter TauE/SafE family protein [Gammaproteobacteria bacterium]